MTILEDGFLSSEMPHWIEKHRDAHSELFLTANKINKAAQQLAAQTKFTITAEPTIETDALALFMRALSNFQGAYILAERGLEVEAKVLARTCLETAFCLGALANDGYQVIEDMRQSAQRTRVKFINWVSGRPSILDQFSSEAKEFSKEKSNQLKDVAASSSSLKELNYENLAQRSGAHDMYVWYRLLSEDVHVSCQTLERYIISSPQENVLELDWGPNIATELRVPFKTSCPARVV
jgi:hypothetical protein